MPKKTSSSSLVRRAIIVLAIIAALLIVLAFIILLGEEEEHTEEICDLIDNDGDGQVDEGFATTCISDASCGPQGLRGEAYCQGNNLVQDVQHHTCVDNPGTCLSRCVTTTNIQIVQECENGCFQGSCRS